MSNTILKYVPAKATLLHLNMVIFQEIDGYLIDWDARTELQRCNILVTASKELFITYEK